MQEPPLLCAGGERSPATQPPAEPLHFPRRTLGPLSSRSLHSFLLQPALRGCCRRLKYSSNFHLFPRGSCSSQVPAWDKQPQALGSKKPQTQSPPDPPLCCCGAFQQPPWVGAEPSKFIAYVLIKVCKPANCGAKLRWVCSSLLCQAAQELALEKRTPTEGARTPGASSIPATARRGDPACSPWLPMSPPAPGQP